jgi:hypothetical protein
MEPVELLRELGLNQLEAEIYLFLLPQPALTAYKIAKHLGKPAANVYKAVDVLARKGAVLLEDGDARTCRAVPAKQFLRRAEHDFAAFTKQAARQLSRVEAPPLEERVYRLETADQVYARCREMAESTTAVLVADAFPVALARIAPWLEAAAARGVAVYVEAYEPIEIAGARVTMSPVGTRPVAMWRAQQLNLVSDGRENLMALLNLRGEGLLQAFWSNSLYLSCLQHAGRLCEQTLIRALAAHERGEDVVAVLQSHPFFLHSKVPGQEELVQRYASVS